jgi:hypothetical protein
MKTTFSFIFIFLSSILYLNAQDSRVSFKASDTTAVNTFNWAKQQALNYAFFNDPVGPWYEAAIAGREAFCIRDMVHQSMGAHILGLDNYTKNMLHKIVTGMSKSKDWCSFWEINRYGDPAPVDYDNDEAFWYNLPANFNVIDCCYRMFLWTGDRSYITDSVFLNFYKHTVYDYVERWDLGIDKLMKRERIMNVSANVDPNARFRKSRGIPGYDETNVGFRVGLEQLVAQYSGYLAYARIQQFRGNNQEADKFLIKAREMLSLINTVWWDTEKQSYFFYLDKDLKLVHDQPLTARPVLFWDAADPSKLKLILDSLTHEVIRKPRFGNIYQSQMCMDFYKYGISVPAYDLLKKFTNGRGRTYPEMSFTAIEAIAAGLMGIEMEVHYPKESITQGGYVDRNIVTTSRLPGGKGWAELDHFPVRTNDITIRHEGLNKTIMTNNSGPGMIWKAKFYGSFDILYVNDYTVKATKEVQYPGGPEISWARLEVAPGESVIVKTNK